MKYPGINIDLLKIKYNTEAMVRQCHQHSIKVAGVTKLFCGHPKNPLFERFPLLPSQAFPPAR